MITKLPLLFFLFVTVSFGFIFTLYFPSRKLALCLGNIKIKKELKKYNRILLFLPYLFIIVFTLLFKSLFALCFFVLLTLFLQVITKKYFSESFFILNVFFNLSLILSFVFNLLLFEQTGSWFLSGGDDRGYFERSIWVAKYFFQEGKFLWLGAHPGYYYTLGFFYHLKSFFKESIFNDFAVTYSIFHFFNVWVMSFLLIYSRKLCLLIFNEKVNKIFTCLFFLSPSLCFFNYALLRDGVVACLVCGTIVHSLSLKNKPIFHLIALLIFWTVLLNYRFMTALLILAVLGSILFLNIVKKAPLKKLLIIATISLVILMNVKIHFLGYSVDFTRIINSQLDFQIQEASSTSLGAKLLKLPLPIRVIAAPYYYCISPLPFISLDTLKEHNFSPFELLRYGNSYFVFLIAPFYFIGLYNIIKYHKKPYNTVIVLLVFFTLLLSLTSPGERHKTMILVYQYMVVSFGIYSLNENIHKGRLVYQLCKLMTMMPTFFYIFLKTFM